MPEGSTISDPSTWSSPPTDCSRSTPARSPPSTGTAPCSAKGTIEERIVALHHHKRDLAERLLEGADAPARLDAGELLELLCRPMG